MRNATLALAAVLALGGTACTPASEDDNGQ
jgi:hypothetical protein